MVRELPTSGALANDHHDDDNDNDDYDGDNDDDSGDDHGEDEERIVLNHETWLEYVATFRVD